MTPDNPLITRTNLPNYFVAVWAKREYKSDQGLNDQLVQIASKYNLKGHGEPHIINPQVRMADSADIAFNFSYRSEALNFLRDVSQLEKTIDLAIGKLIER